MLIKIDELAKTRRENMQKLKFVISLIIVSMLLTTAAAAQSKKIKRETIRRQIVYLEAGQNQRPRPLLGRGRALDVSEPEENHVYSQRNRREQFEIPD